MHLDDAQDRVTDAHAHLPLLHFTPLPAIDDERVHYIASLVSWLLLRSLLSLFLLLSSLLLLLLLCRGVNAVLSIYAPVTFAPTPLLAFAAPLETGYEVPCLEQVSLQHAKYQATLGDSVRNSTATLHALTTHKSLATKFLLVACLAALSNKLIVCVCVFVVVVVVVAVAAVLLFSSSFYVVLSSPSGNHTTAAWAGRCDEWHGRRT